MNITINLVDKEKRPAPTEENLGFGRIFTPHMFVMTWETEKGWHDARIQPFAPFEISPASSVLHYAQEIFEGMKAYRQAKDRIVMFRPEMNAARMNRSAARMDMPEIPVDDQLEILTRLIDIDRDYVPRTRGNTLYIRPAMMGDSHSLGAHSASRFIYFVILSPSGSYYPRGLAPTRLKVERRYVRAVKGGVGFAKTGGNYAASFKGTTEAIAEGFDQVVWLDGKENRYVQEAGAMNIMFVADGKLYTGALGDGILPGITRDSVLMLAKEMGLETIERPIDIQEVKRWADEGRLTEAFGTGTAAAISPIGELNFAGEPIIPGDGQIGPIARHMYETLLGIQYGELEDRYGWIYPVPDKSI